LLRLRRSLLAISTASHWRRAGLRSCTSLCSTWAPVLSAHVLKLSVRYSVKNSGVDPRATCASAWPSCVVPLLPPACSPRRHWVVTMEAPDDLDSEHGHGRKCCIQSARVPSCSVPLSPCAAAAAACCFPCATCTPGRALSPPPSGPDYRKLKSMASAQAALEMRLSGTHIFLVMP